MVSLAYEEISIILMRALIRLNVLQINYLNVGLRSAAGNISGKFDYCG